MYFRRRKQGIPLEKPDARMSAPQRGLCSVTGRGGIEAGVPGTNQCRGWSQKTR